MAIHMTDQIDYEYDFFDNKNKATGETDEAARYPAAYLKYSRSFTQIVMGTQNGVLCKLTFAAEKIEEEEEDQQYGARDKQKKVLDQPLTLLGRFHTAPISGIRELNDSTQFITISEDNTMAIWETTTQQQLSITQTMDRPVSLAVNASGNAAFVGTEGGAFLVYDVSNRYKPRLVKQIRFFEEYIPLDLLVTSLNGEIIMLSSTQSDKIFVTSQKSSRDYTIYGFLQMAGIIHSISFYMKDNAFWVGGVLSNNLLQVCKLPTERQENRLAPIGDDKTHTTFRKVDPGTNRIMTSALTNKFFVTGDDKYLKQYDKFPVETYENLDWRKEADKPTDEYISHSIGTSCVHFSLSLKKMATGGKDGLVIVRDPMNVRSLKEFQTHSVVGGGVSVLCLSEHQPVFYVAGVDGSILVVSVDDNQFPKKQMMPAASDEMSILKEQQPCAVQDMSLFTDVM
jgi:WD40 repeat protein